MSDELIKGAPGDVLHRDVVDTVRFGNVKDRDDVRMVQGRSKLRFLYEAPLPVGGRNGLGSEYLDGDKAA